MVKFKHRGKLNIDPAIEGMHVICHNFPEKKKCDNCMGCFDEHCNGAHCDAHGDCLCIRTECICQGR